MPATAPNPTAPATAPLPVLTETTAKRLTTRWFALLSVLLAGLAIGGKGFAYIGLPPLFISEITLGLGALCFLIQPRWREALTQPVVVLILVLMAWGIARTLPYLGEYRLDAPRDFMLLGYMATAIFVTAVIMSQPQLLPWVLGKYQGFAKVFLIVMPPLWLIDVVVHEAMPTWPWASDVGIIMLKPGDMPVHLGAIAALCVLGLFRGKSLVWMGLLTMLLGVTGMISRGGLASFALAFGIAFLMRPKSAWATRLAVIMITIVTLVAISDVSVQVPGREREFSARQLLLNVVTIFDSGDAAGDLDDTKTWRLDWWQTIFDYTIGGEYFWQGKGFGVNLANDDGFQVWLESESLRSPHNGHLTVLARAGVPGFVLWCSILGAWCWMMLSAYLQARQRGDQNWAMFFVLLVAYWTALSFNASVDVYFEGPMGGVWYWAVTGLGIGGAWVYRRHPEVMNVPHAVPREVDAE
ncbi:MAG: O-antigen ligase family protein [Planctomycetota bacterium]